MYVFTAGKSKRASALVATVERATEIFIERGQTIAYENPEITQQMLTAVEDVRKAGEFDTWKIVFLIYPSIAM